MAGVEIVDLSKLIAREREALANGKYVVTERLVLTPSKQLVREDQAFDGGTLLYRIGDEIPLAEAQRLGLIAEVATVAAAPEVITKAPTRAKGK